MDVLLAPMTRSTDFVAAAGAPANEPSRSSAASAPTHVRVLLPFVAVAAVLVGLSLLGFLVLSSVRAYVGGESLWSKGRSQATQQLRLYVLTGREAAYDGFRAALSVPLGDRRGREALEQPRPDHAAAREGFIAGGNHVDDVDAMIWLFRCCSATPLMRDSVHAWREGDRGIDELLRLGEAFHQRLAPLPPGPARWQAELRLLNELAALDLRIAALEARFSASLGVASRRTLMLLAAGQLALAVTLLLAASAFVRRGLREREAVAAAARRAEVERSTAERVEKARVDFLSRLSHELRTPLNAVIGFSQLMLNEQQDPLSEQARKRTGHVLDAGEHLLHLVDEVLDLTRIDAGVVVVEPKPTSVQAPLEKALVLAAAEIQRYGIEVACSVPAEPARVVADAHRLEQVFLNLASNGCKYNRRGGELRIEVRTAPSTVRIAFADEGEGLSSTQIDQLFQPFKTMTRRRDVQTVGLGLVIVKMLVEQMGGVVEVSSELGRGSIFTVVLPAA
jgi:signal transduction histidine kinase